jgi:peptide/nickel transport system substrate-binding protein
LPAELLGQGTVYIREMRVPIAILAAAAALIVPGTAPGESAAPAAKPRFGGTVVFATDVRLEPRTLNAFVSGGEFPLSAAAQYATMAGAFTVTPRLLYRPNLVRRAVATVRPFGVDVTYHIRRNARWSDGRPITADDFVFTWRTFVDKRWNILVRLGYEDIVRSRRIDAKTVRFTFRGVFSGWRDLFPHVLPRHVLEGEDFNEAWKDRVDDPKTGRPIASGPFVVASWNRGSSMVLERNERYWGRKSYLRRIVFRLNSGLDEQIRQFEGGEIDVAEWHPENTGGLRIGADHRVQSIAGPVWEKLDVNFRGHPLLRKRFMRAALAHALNREAIARRVAADWPGRRLPVLNSAIILSSSAFHVPHWRRYGHNLARARGLLRSNGCRAGSDGIFVCAGQRASFRWVSTSGGRLRERAFEVARDELRRAGIEVVADFAPPTPTFEKWQRGDFDLIAFAWITASPDLSGWDRIYGCRMGSNFTGYCNPRVHRLFERANVEAGQRRQAALVNQALALMAADIAILPLYQLPTLLIHKRTVRGLVHHPLAVGPFWNLNQGGWWVGPG